MGCFWAGEQGGLLGGGGENMPRGEGELSRHGKGDCGERCNDGGLRGNGDGPRENEGEERANNGREREEDGEGRLGRLHVH